MIAILRCAWNDTLPCRGRALGDPGRMVADHDSAQLLADTSLALSFPREVLGPRTEPARSVAGLDGRCLVGEEDAVLRIGPAAREGALCTRAVEPPVNPAFRMPA